MRIELIHPWMGHQAGAILDLIPSIAGRLINAQHIARAIPENEPTEDIQFERAVGFGRYGSDKMVREAAVQK